MPSKKEIEGVYSVTELSENNTLTNNKKSTEQELLVDFETDNDPSITLGEAIISNVTWNCYPYKPKCQSDWDQLVQSEMKKIA